jgi:hypothetical protein
MTGHCGVYHRLGVDTAEQETSVAPERMEV